MILEISGMEIMVRQTGSMHDRLHETTVSITRSVAGSKDVACAHVPLYIPEVPCSCGKKVRWCVNQGKAYAVLSGKGKRALSLTRQGKRALSRG